MGKLISEKYNAWKDECEARFLQLKKNEEELNRIFIDIYGLQDELTPDVADKDITVHRVYNTKDDVPESMKGSNYVRTKRDEVVSLISYAVGCMFGRYSLDVDGLAYAGGEWDASKYQTFIPDKDNIIPICDDDYFDDDMTGRFVKWVEGAYGKDTLEENLRFIADALGGRGTSREIIRSYFLNDFYADHLKTYQKRPIYWLFDSGKKNGFKALIYMHRYQPDLLARMRTDYVHEQQERYRTQLQMLEDSAQSASASDRVKLNKQITKLKDQALEIQKFEEKIHHLADQMIEIDLDDGVKVNYAKLEDVLAKIK
jgi:type II restriction/modification system DNA methylase subunit YeeA